ncbi:MAG: hypothetical protein WC285_05085 [Candidatus Gracilibacteria bacterium]|jgi:peptidoglycan hydrolase CwlO-like protein
MKKILALSILSIILLSGCTITEEIQKFGDDVSDSYQKAAKETKETIEEVNQAKAKLEETVKDIKEAKEKIKEASDAIGEIAK